MCYNLSKNDPENKLIQKINQGNIKIKDFKFESAVYIKGYDHPTLPIIKQDSPNEISTASWGLVPPFITDEKKAFDWADKTLNAKCETVFETLSYKDSIMTKRCLIPVQGFFEWRTEGKFKYPYFIYLKNEPLFFMGGVYSEHPTGTTFSIVTTPANRRMAVIHNLKKRMPLIVSGSEWLENIKKDDIIDLMKPFDENLMADYTIKKLPTKDYDKRSLNIITQFEYPELTLLDNFITLT